MWTIQTLIQHVYPFLHLSEFRKTNHSADLSISRNYELLSKNVLLDMDYLYNKISVYFLLV